jgi:hypothetical protein
VSGFAGRTIALASVTSSRRTSALGVREGRRQRGTTASRALCERRRCSTRNRSNRASCACTGPSIGPATTNLLVANRRSAATCGRDQRSGAHELGARFSRMVQVIAPFVTRWHGADRSDEQLAEAFVTTLARGGSPVRRRRESPAVSPSSPIERGGGRPRWQRADSDRPVVVTTGVWPSHRSGQAARDARVVALQQAVVRCSWSYLTRVVGLQSNGGPTLVLARPPQRQRRALAPWGGSGRRQAVRRHAARRG